MPNKKKSQTGTGKKVSAKKAALKSDEDKRSGRRVPIQLLVDYRSEGHYLFDFCKDLGTGGVFIQTKKPLPQGTDIDLTFTLPDSKETLKASGEVIWVQNQVVGRQDLTPGMGVQFRQFSGAQRQLLEDFIVRYHGKHLGPEIPTTKQHAG
jgi:type IV pilus assembly protein PilZ